MCLHTLRTNITIPLPLTASPGFITDIGEMLCNHTDYIMAAVFFGGIWLVQLTWGIRVDLGNTGGSVRLGNTGGLGKYGGPVDLGNTGGPADLGNTGGPVDLGNTAGPVDKEYGWTWVICWSSGLGKYGWSG